MWEPLGTSGWGAVPGFGAAGHSGSSHQEGRVRDQRGGTGAVTAAPHEGRALLFPARWLPVTLSMV